MRIAFALAIVHLARSRVAGEKVLGVGAARGVVLPCLGSGMDRGGEGLLRAVRAQVWPPNCLCGLWADVERALLPWTRRPRRRRRPQNSIILRRPQRRLRLQQPSHRRVFQCRRRCVQGHPQW